MAEDDDEIPSIGSPSFLGSRNSSPSSIVRQHSFSSSTFRKRPSTSGLRKAATPIRPSMSASSVEKPPSWLTPSGSTNG
jgi:hypothetical protein